MIPETTLRGIVQAIHSHTELYGCIIGFHGNNQSRVLHEGYIPSSNYGRVMVIVEESSIAQSEVNVQSTSYEVSPEPTVALPPAYITNSSRVNAELTGAGISCTLAVISGVGVIGGVAAEVPTAGASTLLVVMVWTGFVTSGIQCVNAIVRSVEAVQNPDSNSLQRWDSNEIYSTSILIVDAVGVVSSLISLPFATRNLLAILERRGGMVAAGQLERMSRPARQEAIERALQQATRTPEGRAAIEQALREAGLNARQVAQVMAHGAGTARRARVVSQVITAETARRLNATIRDIVGGVSGVVASGTSSRSTGSASGSVRAVMVHVLNVPE